MNTWNYLCFWIHPAESQTAALTKPPLRRPCASTGITRGQRCKIKKTNSFFHTSCHESGETESLGHVWWQLSSRTTVICRNSGSVRLRVGPPPHSQCVGDQRFSNHVIPASDSFIWWFALDGQSDVCVVRMLTCRKLTDGFVTQTVAQWWKQLTIWKDHVWCQWKVILHFQVAQVSKQFWHLRDF